jgi:hypothetical protein
MSKNINLNPEMVRLAQLRARNTGCAFELELSRAVAEESVLDIDPEAGFLIDSESALSSVDGLAAALGANDIVVNDRHIDVRVLDADNSISIARALVGTPYLALGSLVVKLDGRHSGAVVGYVGPGGWLQAEQKFAKEQSVTLSFEAGAEFDLAQTLSELGGRALVPMPVAQKSLPDAKEISLLLTNKEKLIMARQKQMVCALIADAQTMELAREASRRPSVSTRRTLSDAAVWESRVDGFAERVADKFSALSKEEIRSQVRKTGEIFGGQPEAPAFRKDVLAKLTREQLVRKFQGVPAAKVMGVVDQVLSGQSVVDTVKDLVKNKVAVDLAFAIKSNRRKVEGLVAASAEEIGAAFKQLALQPAYATHSADQEGSGVDAVNEALLLLEAGDLAQMVKDLDQEMTAR